VNRVAALLVALAASTVLTARGAEDHSGHRHAPADEARTVPTESVPTESVPTESELAHVPPDPPAHAMHDMSTAEMVEVMQMDDTAPVGLVLLDQLEWREIEGRNALSWDGLAWYGNDYDKVWFEAEGETVDGDAEGRVELAWDRIFASWWSAQAGARHDFGDGAARTWAAFGVQGLAPYWFDVDATLYVGESGRTAARFSAEYELLLTQRLILQPELELALYGKDDPENRIGSGLSNTELGLRLRYEIRREIAPYVGIVWTRLYGDTKDLADTAGDDTDDWSVVAGVRLWF